MADLRYIGKFGSKDGNVYQVRLHDSAYDGDPGEFPLQSVRSVKGRRGADIFTPIRASSVELTGYKLTEDALDELLGAEVGRFTMEIWRGESHDALDLGGGELYWKGIVLTDLGEDDTASSVSDISIAATDGLSLLREVSFLDTTGEEPLPYSGRMTHLETITACLAKIGYSLPVSVSGFWYPNAGSGGDILWEHAEVDQSIFYDDAGRPASCYEVIKQVLYPYGGILFWREGRFVVIQKPQIGSGAYTTNDYDDTGEGDGTTVLGATVNADSAVRHSGQRTLKSAVGGATVVYNHGNIPNLIRSGDFEEDGEWSFGAAGGEIRSSGGQRLVGPRGNVGRYSAGRVQRIKVGFVPAFMFGTDTSFTAFRDAIKGSNRYLFQAGEEVQAGDIISFSGRFRIPHFEGAGQGLYNTFFELQIGTNVDGYLSRSGEWYEPTGSDDLQALQIPGSKYNDYGFSLSRDPGEGWYDFTIVSKPAPYTGTIRLTLYGTADETGSDLDPEGVEWADVAVLIVDEDGDLRDSTAFSGVTPNPEPVDEDLITLIGQGPHPGVPGRVTWDGVDSGDWTDGVVSSEDLSKLLVRTRIGYQSQRIEQRFEVYSGLNYEMGDPVQIGDQLYDVIFHEKDLASQDDTIEAVQIRYLDNNITFAELARDIGTYVPNSGGSTSVISTPAVSNVELEKGDLLVGDGEGNTVKLPVPADGFFWVADSSSSLGWKATPITAFGASSEITLDYKGDADVRRWSVTAKAAKLPGSGEIDSFGWVITGDQLPDELIDSDEATAEASGAPGLRASLDAFGLLQIGLHIVDFTPAAGGAGGGASAEIWLGVGSYTAGADVTVTLWWNKSGKTQPAADADYGKNSVYGESVRATWKDEDYSDATANGNDLTPTNITNPTDSPYGTGLKSYEFNGTSSRMNAPDDPSLDIDTKVTVECWFKIDADTGVFQVLLNKRGPATTFNYGVTAHLGGSNQVAVVFYNSGYKGTSAPWTTHFGSVDTWYHGFFELEEIGSLVHARVYKGATLVASASATSTLPPNGSDLILGANNSSGSSYIEWFDGHLKAVSIYDVILSADQKTARDNNQSDPADFWDTTASVESGPFS